MSEHAEARTPPEPMTRPVKLRFSAPRHPALVAALALSALSLLLLLAFVVDRMAAAGRVQRGVWVGSIAASGLESTAVEREVERMATNLAARRVPVQIGRALFGLHGKAVGFSIDSRRTALAAFDVGRQGGAFAELISWLRRFRAPVHVAAVASLDDAALDRVLADWEARALEHAPFEGAVRVEGEALRPDYPRAGVRVDRQAARRLIVEQLLDERAEVLPLPTRPSEPRLDRTAVDDAVRRARLLLTGPVELIDDASGEKLEIAVGALAAALTSRPAADPREGLALAFDAKALEPALSSARARIERPAEDARFTIDPMDRITIVPSRPGMRLDAERVARAALEAALSLSRSASLPIVYEPEPRFTTEQARELGIVRLVGKFSTRHACCQPRVHNIHRIAALMNDVIVRPGETLSVNSLVGPRTQKNGFVMAPGIEEGEMVDTTGGGVSQFATTLFNAVFHAGYDIVERQAHSYWFPRYPMGHEATLSFPKPDLVFKNDTAAGLLIKTEYSDTRITVKLFGDNFGRKVSAEVSGQREVVQPAIELLPNRELLPDESKVAESGMIGWSVLVSRVITYPDGSQKRESRKVTYKPRPRRVEVHPCKIPEGQPGHTGDRCPEPEAAANDGRSPEDIPEVP